MILVGNMVDEVVVWFRGGSGQVVEMIDGHLERERQAVDSSQPAVVSVSWPPSLHPTLLVDGGGGRGKGGGRREEGGWGDNNPGVDERTGASIHRLTRSIRSDR